MEGNMLEVSKGDMGGVAVLLDTGKVTANNEHLTILKQGVDVWNQWRKDNINVKPALTFAKLHEADLNRADLQDADLRRANLTLANLTEADVRGADLRGADLSSTHLRGAD